MLSSDEAAFGGFENLSKKYDAEFASTAADYDGRPHSIQVSQVGLAAAHRLYCAGFMGAPVSFSPICHENHCSVVQP